SVISNRGAASRIARFSCRPSNPCLDAKDGRFGDDDRAARTPKLECRKIQRVSSRASEASRGIPFARASGSLDSLRSLGMTRLRKDSGISYRGAASRIARFSCIAAYELSLSSLAWSENEGPHHTAQFSE